MAGFLTSKLFVGVWVAAGGLGVGGEALVVRERGVPWSAVALVFLVVLS